MEEKLKRYKTAWGSTAYRYRGVDIYNRRDYYYYEVEHIDQFGGLKARNTKKIWYLKAVAGDVDESLATGRYLVENGRLVLTPEEVEKQSATFREEQEKLREEYERVLLECIGKKDYKKAGSYLNWLQDVQKKLENVQEPVTA